MGIDSGDRFLKWLLRHAPLTNLEGFQVDVSLQHKQLLRQGLIQLRQRDPRGFGRLERYIKVILEGYSHKYAPTMDLCTINLKVADTPMIVGTELIHIATYGYLMRRRGWPYEGPWRERYEKICVAEKLRFIRRSLEFTSMPPSKRTAYYDLLRKHFEGELESRYWEIGVIRHTLKSLRLSWK